MRSSFRTLVIATIFAGPLTAQQSLRSRLAPITAPIRRAGVYHVATGTWSRNASLANVTGPDTIYNNTCSAWYYTRMQTGDLFQHRSRIPSTSGPVTGSTFYFDGCYSSRNDEAPGCHDSYSVNGFQVSYCSSATTVVDWVHEFASSYTSCGTRDMISQYTWSLTGLPGGTPSGAQRCWLVDVDLSSSTPAMVLSADGDGTYTQASRQETFGWSFGPTNNIVLGDWTGPIIAGNFTWTGGLGPGAVPCAGTDGTIWDNPINLAESGTGMSSLNYFRMTGTNSSAPSGPGCYDFTGNRHADFWLNLYADAQCPASQPLTEFCFPVDGGIKACTPCSPANPPSAHGRGCNNYGSQTGGATLSAMGNASIAHDTAILVSDFENNTAFTVLMQGTATANVVFGAGIRCVGGNLKRLYAGSAGGNPPCQVAGRFIRPSSDDTRRVHQASFDAG